VLINFNGGSIQCTGGCVWLTHDGDCRDVLLEAGQLHVSDRNSRLAILRWSPLPCDWCILPRADPHLVTTSGFPFSTR